MLPISPRYFVTLIVLINCFYQSVASGLENGVEGDSIAVVSRVVISGNNITKERVITRELMFEQGDTIDLVIWDRILSRSRENLMNLGIFNFVDVTAAKDPGAGYTVLVNVVERWYILPLPRFELVDRNFNEWVRSGELGRFNYGLDLDWSNFRGMNESLKFQFKWGYTRRISLSYQIPYINSSQDEGLAFFGSYTASKEIGYGVEDSKLLLYDAVDGYARQETACGLRYTHKKGYFNSTSLGLEFRDMNIADTIVELNPTYLNNVGGVKQRMLTFTMGFRRDLRDYKYYPLSGYLFDIDLLKSGWGLFPNEPELFQITSQYRKYLKFASKWHGSYAIKGRLSGKSDNPYWVQRAFGYGNDLVRGYEYYVVPGQNYFLFKTNVKYTLMKTKVVELPLRISEKFKSVPNAFYLNFGFESGYVRDNRYASSNTLANQYQYGYGLGLDYVTYYNLVFSVEYSMNRMKESGFFLHFAAPI
ncbi:MAG: hypothetical protein RL090_1029 [Bacteroidota bacterium]|jgi:outer membrane protein assembly factor BamA